MDSSLQILGLAYKAKKTVLGEEVLKKIAKVDLLFIASDISEKSRERLEKKCFHYGIPLNDRFSAEQLSAALGRKIVKVIGITDKGFAETLLEKMN